MKIYHTATQEDYDALMIELEEKGYKWLSGHKPTFFRYWEQKKENSCIKISGKDIAFRDIEQCKKQCPYTTIVEYKAKGDKQMLNTECKQCHKKWHHDNAKYCTMCGNKLVDGPEFRVGDIVASKIFADGSFGLVRLNEDLTNRFTSVDGFWYIKRDCAVRDESLVVFIENTRHATPEEIAEYEAALTFHERGRKPFEVKQGDIISDRESNKLFIDVPSIWNKKYFTSLNYTFLKTVEKVNEWLGADDE